MYKKNIKNENIDLHEIDKFSSIANRWWDINQEFKFLHKINFLRLQYISKNSNGLYRKKILDIGCGGGILTESMAKRGAIVTGLDVSKITLKIAHAHAIKNNLKINYLLQTAEKHALFLKNYYDIVTCMETLEHIPNPKAVVYACAKLVKSGGHVFFSTINRNIKSYLAAIIFAEYILRIIPYGTHDFKKFIRPCELLNWVDNTTLYEKNIIGIKYNILSNSFKLSSDININYLLHAYSDK